MLMSATLPAFGHWQLNLNLKESNKMSNRMMYATDAEVEEIKKYQSEIKMNRTYENMTTNTAKMFVGVEVERTPYFGLQTLFVVGSPQDQIDLISKHADENNCGHIFLGANHSYAPQSIEEAIEWSIAISMLAQKYKVSIDVGSNFLHYFKRSKAHLVKDVCLQVRLEIGNLHEYNDLVMIKIDDTGFRHSNPGIWTTPLTTICSEKNFTTWDAYKQDKVVK